MRVRDWQDILEDVVRRESNPNDWRAVAGRRREGVGEDLFLGHPSAGVYQLKTYARNPYEVKGVGARVARRVDDGIDPLLPNRDHGGRFAVRGRPEDESHAESMARRLTETVRVHAEAPTTADDFFEDMMEAIESPAYGPMEFELANRPERLEELSEEFTDAERLLNAELDDLIEEDGVDRGFQ